MSIRTITTNGAGGDCADASQTEIERLRKLLELQQASYEREIVLAVAAELERCVQVVMDFPIWIGNKGKAELAAALSPKRR